MTVCFSLIYKNKIIALVDSLAVDKANRKTYIARKFFYIKKRNCLNLMSGKAFYPDEIYPLFENIESHINRNESILDVCKKIDRLIKIHASKTASAGNYQLQTCGFDNSNPKILVNFAGKISDGGLGIVTGTEVIVSLFQKKYNRKIKEILCSGNVEDAIEKTKEIVKEAVKEENQINQDLPLCDLNFNLFVIEPNNIFWKERYPPNMKNK